jgi:hypothetical protein
MEKRSFGKLQLTRETLKNLTTEQLDKVVGGRTQLCTTETSIDYSVCWKCQDTPGCPDTYGTCDTWTQGCYSDTNCEACCELNTDCC